jgi:RNA polymerase sigma-70 factor (ECF subfamily)
MTNPVVVNDAEAENPDAGLLRLLADHGDERAFGELYRRHTPRLYALVLRILGSVQDAEDVVQDTWIRAVQGLGQFRGDSRFATWLTSIAVNRIGDRLRRDRRWVFDDAAVARLGVPETAERTGTAIDLERALALLPQGYRTVVLLHDLEGYTHAEIGFGLGIAVGTSKSQLHQARRMLRRILKQDEEGSRCNNTDRSATMVNRTACAE